MASSHRRTSHEITGLTGNKYGICEADREFSCTHKKMSISLNINMVHRACHKKFAEQFKPGFEDNCNTATKSYLPRDNQRLPGPVGTDKQCNAWPFPGSGWFGREYCPQHIHWTKLSLTVRDYKHRNPSTPFGLLLNISFEVWATFRTGTVQ